MTKSTVESSPLSVTAENDADNRKPPQGEVAKLLSTSTHCKEGDEST
jgi:hypothetical protein